MILEKALVNFLIALLETEEKIALNEFKKRVKLALI